MAYCKNCGAYVPDGYDKCLACGMDQGQTTGGTYAQGASEAKRGEDEELRRRMEEQRRMKEEEDRRLEEKRRRMEEDRRWAQAERERRERDRRQRQQQQQQQQQWNGSGWDPYSASRPADWRNNRLFAILSYLPMLFMLTFIFCNKDRYAMFHAKQGAMLFAFTTAGQILGSIFGLGWIFTLLNIYLIIKGINNARLGRMEPLPYIGKLIK